MYLLEDANIIFTFFFIITGRMTKTKIDNLVHIVYVDLLKTPTHTRFFPCASLQNMYLKTLPQTTTLNYIAKWANKSNDVGVQTKCARNFFFGPILCFRKSERKANMRFMAHWRASINSKAHFGAEILESILCSETLCSLHTEDKAHPYLLSIYI